MNLRLLASPGQRTVSQLAASPGEYLIPHDAVRFSVTGSEAHEIATVLRQVGTGAVADAVRLGIRLEGLVPGCTDTVPFAGCDAWKIEVSFVQLARVMARLPLLKPLTNWRAIGRISWRSQSIASALFNGRLSPNASRPPVAAMAACKAQKAAGVICS